MWFGELKDEDKAKAVRPGRRVIFPFSEHVPDAESCDFQLRQRHQFNLANYHGRGGSSLAENIPALEPSGIHLSNYQTTSAHRRQQARQKYLDNVLLRTFSYTQVSSLNCLDLSSHDIYVEANIPTATALYLVRRSSR